MLKLVRRILLVVATIAISSISLQSQVRVQDSSVTTLKAAFDLINAGMFTGDIEIKTIPMW